MPILKQDISSSFFFIIFHCQHTCVFSKFLAHVFSTLDKNTPTKFQFDTFKCSGENSPNLWCHFLNHKSLFLQILHHSSVSWKIFPLYFFSSNIACVGQKELIKGQIFETFKCSCQNSSISSCQFRKTKLIPLRIFYHSSVSAHINHL